MDLIKTKTMDFAVRIVGLCGRLREKEFVVSEQLLRSGSAVGAAYSQAVNADDEKEFKEKLLTAIKKASGAQYWLELLYKTKYINDREYESIDKDCAELISLLQAAGNQFTVHSS